MSVDNEILERAYRDVIKKQTGITVDSFVAREGFTAVDLAVFGMIGSLLTWKDLQGVVFAMHVPFDLSAKHKEAA